MEEDQLPRLVDIGSCSLQNAPVAFKTLADKPGYAVKRFLHGCWQIFHKSSARRDDFMTITGFSMNILCVGDKSPVQRGFFTNSAGDLLPTPGFQGGLYNFCNFVIIFSLM